MSEECDHDYELIDESFDHEFGCELVRWWQCKHCQHTLDYDQLIPDEDYDQN